MNGNITHSRAKKLRTVDTFTLILLVALTLTSTTLAQPSRRENPPKTPTLEERIEKLKSELELSDDQVREMRSIVKGSHKLAKQDRERMDGDFHALALANIERVNRDRGRIQGILTEEQWKRYEYLRKNPGDRKSDHQTGDLILRLKLYSEQKKLFLEISALSRREMRRARDAMSENFERGGFGRGGGAMKEIRAIQKKTDKAIEKILTDEQKKEYKKYKKERDKKMKSRRHSRGRGGRGGRGG